MMAASSTNAADPTPLLEEGGNTPAILNDDADDAPHILLAKKEDEEKVPSSSHFIRDSKLKIWQFRYPLKVISINILSLILVQALLAGGDPLNYHNYYSTSGYQNLQYQTMLRTGLFISLISFLWNASLCLQGAQAMEQKLRDEQGADNGEANTSMEDSISNEAQEFDYVQFSRRVDSTFGSASDGTARSSFIVCLLYALFSFAVWQSMDSGTGVFQVHFTKTDDIPEKGKCFENSIFSDDHFYYEEDRERGIGSLLTHDPNFQSLPLDVRTWISQQNDDGGGMIIIGGGGGGRKKGGVQERPASKAVSKLVYNMTDNGAAPPYPADPTRTTAASDPIALDDTDPLVLPDQASSEESSDEEEDEVDGHPQQPLQLQLQQQMPTLTQGTSDAADALFALAGMNNNNNTNTNSNEDEEFDLGLGETNALQAPMLKSPTQPRQFPNVLRRGKQLPMRRSPNPIAAVTPAAASAPAAASEVTPAGTLALFIDTGLGNRVEVPAQEVDLSTDAEALANALSVDKNQSTGYDDDELKLLEDAQSQGRRSKGYEKKIQAQINRFFLTIRVHGGDILQNLLTIVDMEHTGGRTKDYAFYNIIRGEKTYAKKIILDRCLVLCGMKWLCLSGKTKGFPLAPGSFSKYMGYIFHEWKTKVGILYEYKVDFDDKGFFHGVMIKLWAKFRKQDPKYGTKQRASKFDWDADAKIREAIKDDRLKPFENAYHLQLVIIYVLGRFFLLRGNKEMATLNHHDTYGGTYGRDMGELAGNEFKAIHVPESKTNTLTLDNPEALTKEEQVIECAENPFDIICGVKVMRFFKEKCHPKAIRFFGKVASAKQKKDWSKEHGKEIWYCPGEDGHAHFNVGHNKIGGFMQELGKIIGVANLEKFTNHALRGYAITMMHVARVPLQMRMKFARHKSEQSQLPYAKMTNDGFIQAQLALRGVEGTTHTVVKETNAAMQKSNEEKKRRADGSTGTKKKKSKSPTGVEESVIEVADDDNTVSSITTAGTAVSLEDMSKEDLIALLTGKSSGLVEQPSSSLVVPPVLPKILTNPSVSDLVVQPTLLIQQPTQSLQSVQSLPSLNVASNQLMGGVTNQMMPCSTVNLNAVNLQQGSMGNNAGLQGMGMGMNNGMSFMPQQMPVFNQSFAGQAPFGNAMASNTVLQQQMMHQQQMQQQHMIQQQMQQQLAQQQSMIQSMNGGGMYGGQMLVNNPMGMSMQGQQLQQQVNIPTMQSQQQPTMNNAQMQALLNMQAVQQPVQQVTRVQQVSTYGNGNVAVQGGPQSGTGHGGQQQVWLNQDGSFGGGNC